MTTIIDIVMPTCRLIIEPDGKERLQILINGVWIDVPKEKK